MSELVFRHIWTQVRTHTCHDKSQNTTVEVELQSQQSVLWSEHSFVSRIHYLYIRYLINFQIASVKFYIKEVTCVIKMQTRRICQK